MGAGVGSVGKRMTTITDDDIYTAWYTVNQTSPVPHGHIHGTYAGHDTLCGKPIGERRWVIGPAGGTPSVTCPACLRKMGAADVEASA